VPATQPSVEDRALLASIVGTTASVMPAFLTGAVAVQLAADIGLDDRALGLCIGGYFTSAALGSAVLGRAAERLGGVTAMRAGLTMTAVLGVALAVLVRSTATLGLLLLVAGTSNALTQPAANLLLVERIPASKMGFAFALKQAGMPMASMIGGALVPAVAVTVGWRWAYLIAAVVACGALLALPGKAAATVARTDGELDVTPAPGAARRPDLPLPLLLSYSAVGALGAAAAGTLTSFLVRAAEAAGVAEGPAGLLLTLGSALGIASRLVHGRLADGPRLLPIRRVILLLAMGAAGLMVFAVDRPITYLLGLAPVFAAGWAWPGLFNLSVVRNNPSAPAAATGISQTGIYLGAASGPIVGGLIAAAWGYPTLWLVSAALLATAALLGVALRLRLRRHRLARAAAGPLRG
jgi:predicted MFS family arabinose efflux permease